MSRIGLVRAIACAAVTGFLTCACHQPEQPPLPPPQPTNPTNGRVGPVVAEREIDAGSIVREAGPIPPEDAGIGLFDAAPVGPR